MLCLFYLPSLPCLARLAGLPWFAWLAGEIRLPRIALVVSSRNCFRMLGHRCAFVFDFDTLTCLLQLAIGLPHACHSSLQGLMHRRRCDCLFHFGFGCLLLSFPSKCFSNGLVYSSPPETIRIQELRHKARATPESYGTKCVEFQKQRDEKRIGLIRCVPSRILQTDFPKHTAPTC